jgi:hypothetical protein
MGLVVIRTIWHPHTMVEGAEDLKGMAKVAHQIGVAAVFNPSMVDAAKARSVVFRSTAHRTARRFAELVESPDWLDSYARSLEAAYTTSQGYPR